jgi:hypothetical protein
MLALLKLPIVVPDPQAVLASSILMLEVEDVNVI